MRARIGIMAATVLVVGLAGCGGSSTPEAKDGKVRKIGASWALAADTVQGLAANSDAVVLATINKAVDTGTDPDPVEGVPYTLFSATVSKWFAGTGDDEIIIKQSGDGSVQVEGDPLLTSGEKAVLFLHWYSPGHYFVVGGPTGRFHVNAGGQLLPMLEGAVRSPGPLAALPSAVANAH